MLGFGSPKPKRVTEKELEDIHNRLSAKLDKREEATLEMLFSTALNEKGKLTKGISREEYELGLNWLKDNKKKHNLEDDDIALIERYFEEHLKD